MADDDWESKDFEDEDILKSQPIATASTDKWAGEDEADDIKESWEDDENEAKHDGKSEVPVAKPKKKPLAERIAEREEKKRQEAERRKKEEEEKNEPRTAEQLMAERLRLQRLQEDSDLQLAREALGISNDQIAGRATSIDTCEPKSKEDFDRFGELLQEKITKFEKSTHYVAFLEVLYRNLSVSLESEDIKKLSTVLSTLSNEKAKQQKATKGGKKSKAKAKLNAGKDTDRGDFEEVEYDDYEDFI